MSKTHIVLFAIFITHSICLIKEKEYVILNNLNLVQQLNSEGYNIEPSKISFRPGETVNFDFTLDIKEKNSITEKINFDHTVIISISLQTPDSTFISTITKEKDKSTENVEIYKITITSSIKGENEFFVTLYDFENQEFFNLPNIHFEVTDKDKKNYPDPSNTKLISSWPDIIYENDTISIEFQLLDQDKKIFENRVDFEKYLKVIHNEKESEAKIILEDDGKTFTTSFNPIYPPKNQTINIKFNDNDVDFNIFKDDLITTIISIPYFPNTKVNSTNSEKINVGEKLEMTIEIYDKQGLCINDDWSNAFKVVVTGLNETYKKAGVKEYFFKKNNNTDLDCQNKYEIINKDDDIYTILGKFKIEVYGGEQIIFECEQISISEIYSLDGFILNFPGGMSGPSQVKFGSEIEMILIGQDKFKNRINYPLYNDIEVKLTQNNEDIPFILKKDEVAPGYLEIIIIPNITGLIKLRLFYKGEEIASINDGKELPSFLVFSFCSIENKTLIDTSNIESLLVGEKLFFYVKCFDMFGNEVKNGGDNLMAKGYYTLNEEYTTFEINVTDNENGNYTFEFIPYSIGDYVITIMLNDDIYSEFMFNLKKTFCKEDAPFLCPNKKLCVKNKIDCLTNENNCEVKNQFFCQYNDNESKCVKSQTECDCPSGYYKCSYMNYCVPEKRKDMCPKFKQIDCQKYKGYPIYCLDGICRKKDLSPSQIVCPFGKTLCPDLTCRDSLEDCVESEKCLENQVRCADQSCVNNNDECPSTIFCPNPNQYVCPDGSCVDSEIECERLPICPKEKPYLCSDNLCVKNKKYCQKSVSCGRGLLLCEDLICRTSC